MRDHHFLQELGVRSRDLFALQPHDLEHLAGWGLEKIDPNLPTPLALGVEMRRQVVVGEEPSLDASEREALHFRHMSCY